MSKNYSEMTFFELIDSIPAYLIRRHKILKKKKNRPVRPKEGGMTVQDVMDRYSGIGTHASIVAGVVGIATSAAGEAMKAQREREAAHYREVIKREQENVALRLKLEQEQQEFIFNTNNPTHSVEHNCLECIKINTDDCPQRYTLPIRMGSYVCKAFLGKEGECQE